MLNVNTNLFGFLLSQVGWSGDRATGRRGCTSQGRRVTLKDGTATYMIADFLLVEKRIDNLGNITPNFNECIIFEAKASQGTALTPPQNAGKSVTNSGGTLSVRSGEIFDIPNNSQTRLGLKIQNIDNIKPKKFYKIWSQNGEGNIVDSMKAQ